MVGKSMQPKEKLDILSFLLEGSNKGSLQRGQIKEASCKFGRGTRTIIRLWNKRNNALVENQSIWDVLHSNKKILVAKKFIMMRN